MKVLFDYQIFSMQKYGGISRYYIELMQEYKKLGQEFELPMYFSNNMYLSDIKNINKYKDCRVLNKLSKVISKITSKNHLSEGEYDIFHPTYYDPYFISLAKKPYVITVYDLIHEKFENMDNPKDLTLQWKKESILGASRVLAISENTKKDIIDFYGIDKHKIDVIYLASSLKKTQTLLKINIPGKYLLFVGNRGKYKNFNKFIEAVAPLLKEDKELYVVCAGGGMFNDEEVSEFHHLKINNKVIFIDINNKILAYLYQNALLFVFPSLYEGFGIPILEAMNCDCPVALSATSSLLEIGGAAAIYFNPESIESIYIVIKDTIYNKEKLNKLMELGKNRRNKFSWKSTAEKTLESYRKAL